MRKPGETWTTVIFVRCPDLTGQQHFYLAQAMTLPPTEEGGIPDTAFRITLWRAGEDTAYKIEDATYSGKEVFRGYERAADYAILWQEELKGITPHG